MVGGFRILVHFLVKLTVKVREGHRYYDSCYILKYWVSQITYTGCYS